MRENRLAKFPSRKRTVAPTSTVFVGGTATVTVSTSKMTRLRHYPTTSGWKDGVS